VSTAELAAARTLVLPGMKQVPAPEAHGEQGAREARSIAAALLQTTPPSVGVEDQLLQAEKEERREFEAEQAAAAAAAE
ncbi:TTN, partial [Symbiodinium microadriaticum]